MFFDNTFLENGPMSKKNTHYVSEGYLLVMPLPEQKKTKKLGFIRILFVMLKTKKELVFTFQGHDQHFMGEGRWPMGQHFPGNGRPMKQGDF